MRSLNRKEISSITTTTTRDGTAAAAVRESPLVLFHSTSKAVESNPFIGLGFDDSGNWIPGNPTVLSLLSSVLERSVRRNEKFLVRSKTKDSMTIFHGSKEPSLNIRQFLQRIDAYLTSLNVHRLLITSVLVAAKFMDDQCYNNAYYAKVGGVSREELNRLEMKFLFDLDFRLHVTTEVFNKYWLKIQQGDGENQTDRHIHGRRSKKDETGRGRRFAR
ncbi:Cyclin family protein [Hibiscus syriacus]|uniref:Cyclin family protein n=1 Tax=Hibiscus syriacus TaxID=106335 RepID=A0A6A2Z7C7_HIBSY|nr:Cyclin family protein [Hibiscus syriacus]